MALLRESPRAFGKAADVWTLGLVAEVCGELSWADRPLSPETIRNAVLRLGIPWRRAKRRDARALGPAADRAGRQVRG